MSIIDKIVQLDFPRDQYIRKEYPKSQIILHHTVSGGSAKAVASYWAGKPSRIATCIIIDKPGVPYQLFSSKYWGGHVGGKRSMAKSFGKYGLEYRNCSQPSIGVEIISWGGLKMIDGKLYNCYGGEYKEGDVKPTYFEEGYRGYNYYDSYTEAQIETLRQLLLYWNQRYGISLEYNEDMWDVSEDALKGKNGIWAHTSFRFDKSDIFPQENMVEMLKNLANNQ